MTTPSRSPSRSAPGLALALFLAASVAPTPAVGQHTLYVGQGRPFATVQAALDAASPGDTVRVGPGTYRERLRIERPVVVLGEGRPVLDAGGDGHVVEASASLVLRGFTLRATGTNPDREHAGVMVRGATAVVEDNLLEDVYYGVYLKNAPGSLVRGNRIVGKDLPPPRRGDGIRLWYSSDSRILENEVRRARDVVVYFCNRLSIRGNVITDGRYGLHYMYSDHNEFVNNYFARNQVGAFIMYSRDVRLRENVFAEARGASGMGLGLKDADDVVARDNLVVANQSGIYLDNAPRSAGSTNRFRDNLFLYNGSAVRMLPSVAGNDFRDNSFVGNGRPVEVSGGVGRDQAAQNDWRGNHWSGYAGFDRDGDGVGDTPFRYARLTDDLLSRHPELRLYGSSPVMPILEAVRRFFPLLEPEPVVVDSAPRLDAEALARWRTDPPVRPSGAGPAAGAPDPRGRESELVRGDSP